MRGKDQKGFSLVELIIVISIMAILLGTLTPLYLQYVEKSRVSADIDLMDAIYKACTIAASDDEISDGPGFNTNHIDVNITGSYPKWSKKVLEILGSTDFTSVEAKLRSKVATAADKGNRHVEIEVDAKGNYTVYVGAKTNANHNATGIVAGDGADDR